MAISNVKPIRGVEIRKEHLTDVGAARDVQIVLCSGCDSELIVSKSKALLPAGALSKVTNRAGWTWRSNGKHLCPCCIRAARTPAPQPQPQPTATPASEEAIPMTTKTASKTLSVTTAAPAAPHEMTRTDKRAIYRILDRVYSEETQRYAQDWTDARVAAKAEMPLSWVIEVRTAEFGADASNDEMARLKDSFAALTAQASAAADKAMAMAVAVEALQSEIKTSQARLAKLIAAGAEPPPK